jgi:hypothetical protein
LEPTVSPDDKPAVYGTCVERESFAPYVLPLHACGYVTRRGTSRVDRIALVAATVPWPMKTADNPGSIDRVLMDADLALRTADRPK